MMVGSSLFIAQNYIFIYLFKVFTGWFHLVPNSCLKGHHCFVFCFFFFFFFLVFFFNFFFFFFFFFFFGLFLEHFSLVANQGVELLILLGLGFFKAK